MQPDEARSDVALGDPWVSDLRARLVETGYDGDHVDELITASLARFGSPRVRDFVPLLVERSVNQALRGE